MSLTLSILDQSLVSENEKAETGIQHTVRLAEAKRSAWLSQVLGV